MRRPVVKSASRTLQVLELFSEQRRPLRLHEIYEQLDYPQSSATHLMKSMVAMGYVNYNRTSRTYLPTHKVSFLGSWLSSAAYGETRYHDLAERLQRRTDETVAICTQNDLFIQYVLIKAPEHEFKMPPPLGNMRLLPKSTSGMALLSRMRDRQVDKICRYINHYEVDPENRVVTSEVMRELAWVRHVGYCYREDHPDPGIASMAFPLGDALHGIPVSIGIGGMKSRLAKRKMELVATIREAIAEFHEQRQAEEEDENALYAHMPALPPSKQSANDGYVEVPVQAGATASR